MTIKIQIAVFLVMTACYDVGGPCCFRIPILFWTRSVHMCWQHKRKYGFFPLF